MLGAGVAAGSLSLVQAALGQVLANSGSAGNSQTIVALFTLYNDADTFKLLARALLSAAASILIFRTHALPQWLGWLGAVLAVALFVGGLTFILNSAVLYALVAVTLLLLLVWVAAVSFVVSRRVA